MKEKLDSSLISKLSAYDCFKTIHEFIRLTSGAALSSPP